MLARKSSKKNPCGSVDAFAVFLPYSGRISTTKGGIGDIPIENICPLGRNLTVEKLFLGFFFSEFFKKKLSFFPGGLQPKHLHKFTFFARPRLPF
jgi:hypothetical protein